MLNKRSLDSVIKALRKLTPGSFVHDTFSGQNIQLKSFAQIEQMVQTNRHYFRAMNQIKYQPFSPSKKYK